MKTRDELRQYHEKWKKNNRARYLASKRRYRERNKAKLAADNKRYRSTPSAMAKLAARRDKRARAWAKYRETHRDALRARAAKYRKANRGKMERQWAIRILKRDSSLSTKEIPQWLVDLKLQQLKLARAAREHAKNANATK